MQQRSYKEIRHAVVKNQNESHDANAMAEMENERSLRNQSEKQSKMQQFMNSTRMNASKIFKEQQQKKIETMNAKKIMLQKQKELKSKYTVVDKKKEEVVRKINVQPTKIQWKKNDQTCKGVSIPIENNYVDSSDEEGSGIDSEYQHTQIRTPNELLRQRESIRNKMLNKMRNK